MRVIERGYQGWLLAFERTHEIGPQDLWDFAQAHANGIIAGVIDMIELEFPDCPMEDRYFRIGVNPEGIVMPIAFDLENETGGRK